MYECLLGYPDEDWTDILWTLYSGTLSREKLSQIGGFRGELSWIARFCHAKERHAPNFTEKLSQIGTKTQQKFSPSKVSRYGI